MDRIRRAGSTTTNEKFSFFVDSISHGRRLDKFLSAASDEFSRSQIKKFILQGKVRINQEVVLSPDRKVHEKNHIRTNFSRIEHSIKPQRMPIEIVHEDPHLIVLNKPSNLNVHPNLRCFEGTLLNALLAHCPVMRQVHRCGIVHRLDQNTTGLMIVSKTRTAYTRLVKMMKNRSVIRRYTALVYGNVREPGIIHQPLKRIFKKKIRMVACSEGKTATTFYEIEKQFRFCTQLRIFPVTGRTHQIRAHMLHINHPIVGDPLYRHKNYLMQKRKLMHERVLQFRRQALHADFLAFFHPVEHECMKFNAVLPRDMKSILDVL